MLDTSQIYTKVHEHGYLNSTCIWQCEDRKISIRIDNRNQSTTARTRLKRLPPSFRRRLPEWGSTPFCTGAVFIHMDSSTVLPLWVPGILSLPHWFHASSHRCLWLLCFCNCLKTVSKQISFISLQIPPGLPTVPGVSLSLPFFLFSYLRCLLSPGTHISWGRSHRHHLLCRVRYQPCLGRQ